MINHIFILFTSILPCFRYRTPRLVQAVTFCKKQKQNGSFIHNSLKRACLAAIGQGSEQRTSTTVTAITEITQWSYLVLVSTRNHWQINGQVSLQNKACFFGGRGRRGVCFSWTLNSWIIDFGGAFWIFSWLNKEKNLLCSVNTYIGFSLDRHNKRVLCEIWIVDFCSKTK